jgi:UDP-N-acetylmuramate--alanine ligase
VGKLILPIAGDHNALNALAAILAGKEADIPFETSLIAIKEFKGVDRRFQFKGKEKNIDFYDDYGHHPTEIKSVLEAFAKMFPDRRKIIIFQPHRFSRTQNCWEEFLTSFYKADLLYVTDIYAAGEAEISGIDSQTLVQQIKNDNAQYIPLEKVVDTITSKLTTNDVCITLGAGHIWRFGEEILSKIKEKND